ncbi:hypothetical protein C2S51_017759 [Perilla frutescens var. frutescens]|nr:hypothetical protein C2S51_017759 [Perilla frutescens var. frutescens]
MGKQMESMWQILFVCALFGLIAQVRGQSSGGVPVTLVDGAIEKNAVCIDGTPAGYHFDPGFGDGVNNWIVHLMGGGWCGLYTCFRRIGQFHGSTNGIGPMFFGGILSSNQTANPEFYNWNRVYVRYCDGMSFLGDTEQDDSGHPVQLRGSRIFSAVMDELLQVKGMQKADNVLLSGSSAGGLASILHCDGFRALVPNSKRVKCVADAGFFLGAKNLPAADGRYNGFAGLIQFHNATNILPTSCTSKMNASLCALAEYVVGDIQTPVFIVNSAFDSFQLQNMMKPDAPDLEGWNTKCVNNSASDLPLPRPDTCTPPQMQLIKDFRGTFLDTINGLADVPSRGLFITSCYNHVFIEDNTWTDTQCKLENKTVSEAVGDWYFDRSPVKLIDTANDVPLNCNKAKYGSL